MYNMYKLHLAAKTYETISYHMDWNHFDLSKQAEKWNNGEAK